MVRQRLERRVTGASKGETRWTDSARVVTEAAERLDGGVDAHLVSLHNDLLLLSAREGPPTPRPSPPMHTGASSCARHRRALAPGPIEANGRSTSTKTAGGRKWTCAGVRDDRKTIARSCP